MADDSSGPGAGGSSGSASASASASGPHSSDALPPGDQHAGTSTAAVAHAHAEMEPFWTAARAESEPALARIWKRLPSFPSPALRVQRVNQLDAELLDEELVGLLLEPVKTALANIRATLPADAEPELLLVLRLVLYKLSIWDHGATYGAMIQNLKYRNEWAHRGGLQSTSRDIPLSTLQLSLYPLLTILLPWAHTRAERSMTSLSFSELPTNDPRRMLWAGLERAEKLWSTAALVNFAIFLGDGKYRTLVDRVLGMRLTYARRAMNRNVSFEFLNRQLVWHAFTEFLLFLLPLIRPRRLLRRLTRLPTHPKFLSFLIRFLPAVFTERILGILPPAKGQTRPALVPNGFMSHVAKFTSRGKSSGEKKGLYAELPKGCCAICWQRLEQSAGVSTSGGVAGSSASASLTGASAAFGALGMPSADPLDPTSRFTSGGARVGARRQRPRALQGSQQALANRALKGIKSAARRDKAKRRKERLAERQKRAAPGGSKANSVSGTDVEGSSDESSDEEGAGPSHGNEDDREEALLLGGVSSTGLRYADAALYVPYAAQPCGCLYCYFCLTEKLLGEEAGEELEDEGGWECLRCATRVRGAQRFVAPDEDGEAEAGAAADGFDGGDDGDDAAGPSDAGPGVGPSGDASDAGGPGAGPSDGNDGSGGGGGDGDDLFANEDDEVLDFSNVGQQRASLPHHSDVSEDDEDDAGPPTPTDGHFPSGSVAINPSNLPPFLRVNRPYSRKNDELTLHEEAAALAIRTPTPRRMSAVGPRGEQSDRLFIQTGVSSNPASHLARVRRMSQAQAAAAAAAAANAGVSGAGPLSGLSAAGAVGVSHVVVPPLNFDVVAAGVYRSGHPNERNFDFMERLGLRSIMYLANEDYREDVAGWARALGLNIFHFPLEVNKEPFAEMDASHVTNALSAVVDRRNLPMLIHCNKGKYRVGCLVGCLRRLQGWSHTSIFEEFARFAGQNKIADQEFIEVFDLSAVSIDPENKPEWLA